MYHNQRRSTTVIEKIIFMIFFAAAVVILHSIITGESGEMSIGVNGIVETRCISGYKVTIENHGIISQIIDENGRGIPCN